MKYFTNVQKIEDRTIAFLVCSMPKLLLETAYNHLSVPEGI
jgi:hypothetical protein